MSVLLQIRSALFGTARAAPVSVVLGGAPAIPGVRALRYDKSMVPGFDQTEDGSAFRRVRFEIPFTGLPSRPVKGDSIHDGAINWLVVEVEIKPEVGSWMVAVEEASG